MNQSGFGTNPYQAREKRHDKLLLIGLKSACSFLYVSRVLRWLKAVSSTYQDVDLPKVASYPAYQNSILRKNFTIPFLTYKRLKLKLRVFLAGHSVAMVTYCVTNMI